MDKRGVKFTVTTDVAEDIDDRTTKIIDIPVSLDTIFQSTSPLTKDVLHGRHFLSMWRSIDAKEVVQ